MNYIDVPDRIDDLPPCPICDAGPEMVHGKLNGDVWSLNCPCVASPWATSEELAYAAWIELTERRTPPKEGWLPVGMVPINPGYYWVWAPGSKVRLTDACHLNLSSWREHPGTRRWHSMQPIPPNPPTEDIMDTPTAKPYTIQSSDGVATIKFTKYCDYASGDNVSEAAGELIAEVAGAENKSLVFDFGVCECRSTEWLRVIAFILATAKFTDLDVSLVNMSSGILKTAEYMGLKEFTTDGTPMDQSALVQAKHDEITKLREEVAAKTAQLEALEDPKDGYKFTVFMQSEHTMEFEAVDHYRQSSSDCPKEVEVPVNYINNWITICRCGFDGAEFIHANIANVPSGTLARALELLGKSH